ncbi:MAG: type III secretion system export apparatus subunit SctR [Pseudomonadales bacterium]|nr:type III secretion system export apparatus subunit SctR [Pseudomonadales bacterium]
MDSFPEPIYLIFILGILGLVPFVAMMATTFVKIAIVLSLLRNALGVQQIPPNMAVNGLAIILSAYIMAPVGQAIFDELTVEEIPWESPVEFKEKIAKSLEPYQAFLIKHTLPAEREFFVASAIKLWPKEMAESVKDTDLMVLIPAFTVSELTAAFEIGFLIYLPFLVIDLIISNILLAMGMMMVSPMTISLPFKLLLFVLIDGWTRLIHGLVLSY